jgi:hypothetical protein
VEEQVCPSSNAFFQAKLTRTQIIRNVFLSPLRQIPGPFLAKVTPYWLIFVDLAGHRTTTLYRLHQRYGSMIRIGPNEVSYSNQDIIKEIYSQQTVLHESCHRSSQLWVRVPRYCVFSSLSKVESPCLGWLLLTQSVTVKDHRPPFIAVEIVYSTTGTDKEVAFFSEGAKRGADFDMVVRIVPRVHRDNCYWWTEFGIGKHSNEDQVSVMDPIKTRVLGDIEALCMKH